MIAFQIGWFSCVLMAANNKPEIGIAIASVLVVLHFLISTNRVAATVILIVVTTLGTAWDSLLTSQQVFVFNAGMMADFLAPSWIVMMWVLFSTTLPVSFRWLYGRYGLAMCLGAVFGPLAYQGGAALGAVVIPDFWLANIVLALGWAVLMPVLIKMTEKVQEINWVKGSQ